MRARKKPIEVECHRYLGPDAWREKLRALDNSWQQVVCERSDIAAIVNIPHIHTLEGWHDVTAGDIIIRGVKGEHYPCKPDIFAATYEIVEP